MIGSKISVLVVEPGKPPRREEISGGLAAMRRIVGGGNTEELCPFAEPVSIIRNGNGDRLPPNYLLKNEDGEPLEIIRGTFVAARMERGRYVSLTDSQILRYLGKFSRGRLSLAGVKIVAVPQAAVYANDVRSVGLLLPQQTEPNPSETAERIFRMLLRLEEIIGFENAFFVGVFCAGLLAEPAEFLAGMLAEWQEQAARMEDGEITKADYNRWRC